MINFVSQNCREKIYRRVYLEAGFLKRASPAPLRNVSRHTCGILISSCKSPIIRDVIGFIVLIGCENWSPPITRRPGHDLWGRP